MNSNSLKRLSNIIMLSGKRTSADKVIIKAASILNINGYKEPYKAISDALDMIKPMVELRTIKKSGQSVQVPSAITVNRQEGLAIRFLKEAIRARAQRDKAASGLCLAQEVMAILRKDGSQALGKRDTLHRMAVAQRNK